MIIFTEDIPNTVHGQGHFPIRWFYMKNFSAGKLLEAKILFKIRIFQEAFRIPYPLENIQIVIAKKLK